MGTKRLFISHYILAWLICAGGYATETETTLLPALTRTKSGTIEILGFSILVLL